MTMTITVTMVIVMVIVMVRLVTNHFVSGIFLERETKEGDSPVHENEVTNFFYSSVLRGQTASEEVACTIRQG